MGDRGHISRPMAAKNGRAAAAAAAADLASGTAKASGVRRLITKGKKLYGIVGISGSSMRLKDKSAWACFNPVTYKRVLALLALVLAITYGIGRTVKPTGVPNRVPNSVTNHRYKVGYSQAWKNAHPETPFTDSSIVWQSGVPPTLRDHSRPGPEIEGRGIDNGIDHWKTVRGLKDPKRRMNDRFQQKRDGNVAGPGRHIYTVGASKIINFSEAGAGFAKEKGIGTTLARHQTDFPNAQPVLDDHMNHARRTGRILTRSVFPVVDSVLVEYAMMKDDLDLCRSATLFREDAASDASLYMDNSVAFLIDGQDAMDRGKMHFIEPSGVFSDNCPLAPRCGMAHLPKVTNEVMRRIQNHRKRGAVTGSTFSEANLDIDDGMILGIFVSVTNKKYYARDLWQLLVDIAHGGEIVAKKLGGINRLANAYAMDPATHKLVKIANEAHFMKLCGIGNGTPPAPAPRPTRSPRKPQQSHVATPLLSPGSVAMPHYVRANQKAMRKWGFTGKQDKETVNRIYRGHASKYWLTAPKNLKEAHKMATNLSLLRR